MNLCQGQVDQEPMKEEELPCMYLAHHELESVVCV